MKIVPLELKDLNALVASLHRCIATTSRFKAIVFQSASNMTAKLSVVSALVDQQLA